jgi:integrase
MQENLKQIAKAGAEVQVRDGKSASRLRPASHPVGRGGGSAYRRFRLGRNRRSGPLFVEVAEEWLSVQTHLRPRVLRLYQTAVRRHLAPRIGDIAICDLDEDAIAAVIADLQAQGLAGGTIRGILVPLGRVFAFAIRQGIITDDPLRRLERQERPRVGRREMRILTPDEINDLLAVVRPTYRTLLATAIFTGLRQGELLGLQWVDADFEPGMLHVRRQLDRSGAYVEPKTPRALRSVALMPSLAELLRDHRDASPYSDATDPVFATRTGRPMYYRNVSRRGLAAAVETAGLDRPGEPRLRFHDLRHSYASLLIAQGLNVVFVSRQLGHASAGFTLNVYGGLFDRHEHSRRAKEALEGAFGDMLRSSSCG